MTMSQDAKRSAQPPARLRRRLRFSIRTALLLVAILCGLLAWMSRDVHLAYRRASLSAEAARLGGSVERLPVRTPRRSPLHWITNLWDPQLAEGIQSVSAAGPSVTDAEVARLATLIRGLPEVEQLTLERTSITDKSWEALATCRQLRILDLRSPGPGVTDAGVVALQRRSPMLQVGVGAGTNFTSRYEMSKGGLLLRGPFYTDAYLIGLSDLSFQAVDLSDCRITADGLRSFSEQRSPGWLSLAGATFDDQSLAAFDDPSPAMGSGWRRLSELTLRDTSVTDAGLAQLTSLPRLQRLSLTGTPITDAGLAHIGRITSLEELDLSRTNVQGAGFAHLAGLTKLRRLTLVQTAITDDSLGALPPLPELEYLHLDGTGISDDGVEHLKSFPKLHTVSSRQSNITAAALEVFATRRPPGRGD
jgi:Leucine-rich repeat (LRR) protein